MLRGDLFSERIQPRFNRAILNPPYHKINSGSKTRKLLRSVGIETSNLYTAFVALAIKLLEANGAADLLQRNTRGRYAGSNRAHYKEPGRQRPPSP